MPATAARSATDLQLAAATVLLGGLLLLWDASALDLPLARSVASPGGFPLRDHWLLTSVLHDGGRRLGWLLATALCVGVWWPAGPLRRLSPAARLRLALATLLASLAVSVSKNFSLASCPWDLQLFGGVARYASHWSLLPDGGGGRCFPAGHASAGFAFVSGYFAFRHEAPHLARAWLAAAVAVGLLFGVAQQLRGAHFMSHTLWTGWICWVVAWSVHGLRPPRLEAA